MLYTLHSWLNKNKESRFFDNYCLVLKSFWKWLKIITIFHNHSCIIRQYRLRWNRPSLIDTAMFVSPMCSLLSDDLLACHINNTVLYWKASLFIELPFFRTATTMCEFLFASLDDDETLQKMGLLLKETLFSHRSNFDIEELIRPPSSPPLRRELNWKWQSCFL